MITAGTQHVRLDLSEREAILRALEAVSQKNGFTWSEVSLFGSRIDCDKRGGDIDLFIKVDIPSGLDAFRIKQLLLMSLKDALGDQKIDLVIDSGSEDLGAFGNLIEKTKVNLWKKK